MKLLIKTNATLKSMDYHLDSCKTSDYRDEAIKSMTDKFKTLNATITIDGNNLIVERKNGRGFIQAAKKIVNDACGIYGVLVVL